MKQDSLIPHLNVIEVITDQPLDFLDSSVSGGFNSGRNFDNVGDHDVLDER